MSPRAPIAGSATRLTAERRLRAALDAALDAFWLLDAVRDASGRIVDFRIADLNRRAADTVGVAQHRARGALVTEVVGRDRTRGYIERYAQVVRTGTPDSFEYRHDPQGGDPAWRWISAARAGDGVVLIVRDITDRVLAEREDARREADFRLLAEGATDLIARMTPDGQMTYLSRSCREILGYSPEEMTGRSLWEFVHPHDLHVLQGAPLAGEMTGEIRTVAYRGRRRGGGWVHLESSFRRVRGPDGRIAEVWVAIRDITDRTMTQAEHAALHRVSEAVAEGADVRRLYALVAKQVAGLLSADGGWVVRYLEGGLVEVMGSWSRAGRMRAGAGRRGRVPDSSAVAKVWATGRTASGRLTHAEAALAGVDERVGIAAPVRAEGRLWGAVAATFRDEVDAPDGSAVRVERFAQLVSLAVANAEARARLVAQATTDALTGLVNHPTFHAALAEVFARAARYGRRLTLAIIDLDRFKALNDTLGHRAGDAALARVGELLRAHARRADVVGRIGGEELAWLMPETSLEGGVEAAERLRMAIASAPVAGQAGLTASIGLATTRRSDADPDDVFRRADAALYSAKQHGRDRVVPETG